MPEAGIEAANGLPGAVAMGIASFFALLAAFNKWLDMRRLDATHVGLLEKDRDAHMQRADEAEEKAERAWARLEEVAKEMTEIKVENARLSEQVRSLTQANQQLSARVEEFMRITR